jgi:hypothetical protein
VLKSYEPELSGYGQRVNWNFEKFLLDSTGVYTELVITAFTILHATLLMQPTQFPCVSAHSKVYIATSAEAGTCARLVYCAVQPVYTVCATHFRLLAIVYARHVTMVFCCLSLMVLFGVYNVPQVRQ